LAMRGAPDGVSVSWERPATDWALHRVRLTGVLGCVPSRPTRGRRWSTRRCSRLEHVLLLVVAARPHAPARPRLDWRRRLGHSRCRFTPATRRAAGHAAHDVDVDADAGVRSSGRPVAAGEKRPAESALTARGE